MTNDASQLEAPPWATGDLGLATYIACHGVPFSVVPGDSPASLCRFLFEQSGHLDNLVIAWGRGGQVEAAGYWGTLNDVKRRIREARQDANQP